MEKAGSGPPENRKQPMPRYPTRKTAKDDAIVAGITANPAQHPSGPGQPFARTAFNGLITTKNTAVNAAGDSIPSNVVTVVL